MFTYSAKYCMIYFFKKIHLHESSLSDSQQKAGAKGMEACVRGVLCCAAVALREISETEQGKDTTVLLRSQGTSERVTAGMSLQRNHGLEW